MTFDVTVSKDRLSVRVTPGSDIAAFQEDPETVTMQAVDGSGDRFVGRSDPSEARWALSFSTLPDARPQLYSAGRVAPRV